jgi:predicted Zn finger-like uncharacterized protein
MTTTMKCPGCQTPLRLRADMAGKKIKCPRCGHVLTVPASAEEAVEEVPVMEEITAEPPPKKAARRRVPEDEEDEDVPIQRRSKYKPCPRCGESGATRVVWTPWGSFYGPALFTHVRCPGCGYKYNGRSGRSNLIPAIIFVTVPAVLIVAILGFLGWVVYSAMSAHP